MEGEGYHMVEIRNMRLGRNGDGIINLQPVRAFLKVCSKPRNLRLQAPQLVKALD